MGDPMKLPAGWTEIDDPMDAEIDDPTERREYRHFEAYYMHGDEKRRIETASRDARDAACLEAIAEAASIVKAQGSEIIA